MIRLILIDPSKTRRVLCFQGESVTIGRASDNDICINHSKVSKYHGRLTKKRDTYLYIDLNSTNGTIVHHDGKALAITGKRMSRQAVVPGDVLQIAPFDIKIDSEESVIADESPFTVLEQLDDAEREEIRTGGLGQRMKGRSEPLVHFLRETAEVMRDDARLMRAITRHAFATFPQASHMAMVLASGTDEGWMPVIATSRDGMDADCTISRTIVRHVLDGGSSLHFVNAPVELDCSESIVQGRITTAICAPLATQSGVFGVIQLDVRGASRKIFDREDLALLTIFAHHVGLIVDNMRLYQDQRDAFVSTVSTLALSLDEGKKPGNGHSQAVQRIAGELGQVLDLNETQIERVGLTALLHESDPALLARIQFPQDLACVPELVSSCRERVDGSGPKGLTGGAVPLESRIVAVADAFDMVASRRIGNASRSLTELVGFLESGRDRQWDGGVLDALRECAETVLATVYAGTLPGESDTDLPARIDPTEETTIEEPHRRRTA